MTDKPDSAARVEDCRGCGKPCAYERHGKVWSFWCECGVRWERVWDASHAAPRVSDELLGRVTDEALPLELIDREGDLARDLRDARAALKAAEAQVAALREALQSVEFSGEAGGCPGCGFGDGQHVNGCLVGEAIAATAPPP